MNIHSQDVRFVVGLEGKPTAVLVDIDLRKRSLQALEDAENRCITSED